MSPERVADEAGVVTKISQRSVADTVSRFTQMITDKGMTLFAAIDQSAVASRYHLSPDLEAKLAGIDPLTDVLVRG